MGDPRPDAVLSALATRLAERPEIVAAYLFGSAAKGRLRPDSDLDVAVLLDPGAAASHDDFGLRLDLAETLGAITGRRTDVVILNRAPLSLRYSIYRAQQPIFERDEAAARLFRVRSLSEWYDFEPAQIRAFRTAVGRG